MWPYVVVAAGKRLCQQVRRRFVDSLSDEECELFYVLEVLEVATGLANGTIVRGPLASHEEIERMLYRALCEGAKALGTEEDPVLAVYADTFENLPTRDLARQREILEQVAELLLDECLDDESEISSGYQVCREQGKNVGSETRDGE